MKPVVTVVTLTDFHVGTSRAWDDLRRTLRGLAQQDFKEPVEYILLEDERLKDKIPADLTEILPQLRIELSKKSLQYDLKSDAARLGAAEIVVLLDADCVPVRGCGSTRWSRLCGFALKSPWSVVEPGIRARRF